MRVDRLPPRAAFIPLSTPRLALLALSAEHAPALFACASDPEISSRVAWPRHTSLDDSRHFIARVLVGYAQGGQYEWGIVRCSDQVLIGSCGLGDMETQSCVADVGYALVRPYWGQGYATEAASAVVGFGFRQLGLSAIEAQVFPENAASERVLAKLGMCHVDTRTIQAEGGDERAVRVWRLQRERWLGCTHQTL